MRRSAGAAAGTVSTGGFALRKNLLGDRAQHQPFDARSPVGPHDDEVGGEAVRLRQNLPGDIVRRGCVQCDQVAGRVVELEKMMQIVEHVRAFAGRYFERAQAGGFDIGEHR